MKRMFLLAGLFLLGLAPSLGAATKDCVPDSGCPKGMKSPKCCKPPPCEFFDALQKARVMRDLYYSKYSARVTNQASSAPTVTDGEDELAPLTPEGDDDLVPLENAKFDSKDYEQFKEEVAEALKQAREEFPKCPKRSKKIPDPPIFSVMPDDACVLKTYSKGSFKELSFGEVLEGSTACAELVTAKYEAARRRESGTCPTEAMDSTNYIAQALARGEELNTEYDSLLADLQRFWSRCSIAPDSKLARDVAARGIDELKQNQPKDPPKRKAPSKKSGKGGR